MFSSTVFIYILTIAVSFAIGFLYYYVMMPDTRTNKRVQLDLFSAQLINFVLYIWLAKIIIRLPTFIKDPLAVLAYPSNRTAFYIATVFIFVHIIIKFRREAGKKQQLLQIFIPVFIVAHFVYEFIQAVVIGVKPNLMSLGFYMILTIFYTLMRGKVTEKLLQMMFTFVWLIGQLVLSIFTTTTIFGYVVSSLYFISLLILAIGIIFYHRMKNIE